MLRLRRSPSGREATLPPRRQPRVRKTARIFWSPPPMAVSAPRLRTACAATGILMERCALDRNEAFGTLRGRARSERRRLNELSREMLEALEKVNRLRPA